MTSNGAMSKKQPHQQVNGKSTTSSALQRLFGYEDEEENDEVWSYEPRASSFVEEMKRQWSKPFNEWTFTLCLFLFSLSVIVGKLFLNHDYFTFLGNVQLNKNISDYTNIADKAIIEPFNKYSWFIKALFSGFAVTGMTWLILYKDSNIPGVNPPSPFSPSKKRIYQESPAVELNYFVGGMIGFLMFVYMCL